MKNGIRFPVIFTYEGVEFMLAALLAELFSVEGLFLSENSDITSELCLWQKPCSIFQKKKEKRRDWNENFIN
jgi:hypothetical protein